MKEFPPTRMYVEFPATGLATTHLNIIAKSSERVSRLHMQASNDRIMALPSTI